MIHLAYLTAGAWVCCSQTSSQTEPPDPCTNYLVINLLLITELLSLNLFLKFVSPLYIYSLITTMVIFARCFKCPGNISVSAGKTFATLLILSYSSILKACIESVSFVYFKAVESNVIIRWLIDPTFNYFTGFHICACHHLSCTFGNVHHTTTIYFSLPIQSIPVQMYQTCF